MFAQLMDDKREDVVEIVVLFNGGNKVEKRLELFVALQIDSLVGCGAARRRDTRKHEAANYFEQRDSNAHNRGAVQRLRLVVVALAHRVGGRRRRLHDPIVVLDSWK